MKVLDFGNNPYITYLHNDDKNQLNRYCDYTRGLMFKIKLSSIKKRNCLKQPLKSY